MTAGSEVFSQNALTEKYRDLIGRLRITLLMKHPKQGKRAPPTHPSALAVPSYHRILVKHGLIEKTLPIPDAYEVFLKVGADPEVQKLCRKVEPGSKIKHVPA